MAPRFEYIRNDALDAANFFDNIVGTKVAAALEPIWRLDWWSNHQRQVLLLLHVYEGYRLRAGINSVEAVPGEQARICAAVACNPAIVPFLPAFRDPGAVIISRGTVPICSM